jgi:kynurenine 3-monooxygenase
VMAKVDPITIPMRGRMVHVGGGAELQPYGSREHEVIHSVSRRDLNALLLDAAEDTGKVRLEFGQRCRAVDFDSHTITLTDASKGQALRTERFGTLFGADGARSVVREAIVAAAGGDVSIDELDHGYKELELPAGAGGKFQIDPNALHIWPRGEFMLIALANPSGDFTLTLFAPHNGPEGSPSFDAVQTPVEVAAFFDEYFSDVVSMIPDLADQFRQNPIGHLSTVRSSTWSLGSEALVIGDAAHGIVPFHGQGMNAAMESVAILDRMFDEEVAGPGLFLRFETARRNDTDAIGAMALDNYIEMRERVADPSYQMKRELALELERRWPDHFRPRYGMVMFSTIPYATARHRAADQTNIVDELANGVTAVDQVDFAEAERLVTKLVRLPPRTPPRGDLTW